MRVTSPDQAHHFKEPLENLMGNYVFAVDHAKWKEQAILVVQKFTDLVRQQIELVLNKEAEACRNR